MKPTKNIDSSYYPESFPNQDFAAFPDWSDGIDIYIMLLIPSDYSYSRYKAGK